MYPPSNFGFGLTGDPVGSIRSGCRKEPEFVHHVMVALKYMQLPSILPISQTRMVALASRKVAHWLYSCSMLHQSLWVATESYSSPHHLTPPFGTMVTANTHLLASCAIIRGGGRDSWSRHLMHISFIMQELLFCKVIIFCFFHCTGFKDLLGNTRFSQSCSDFLCSLGLVFDKKVCGALQIRLYHTIYQAALVFSK